MRRKLNRAQAIEEQTKDNAKKLESINTEYDILELLPVVEGHEWFIHVSNLCGTVGSASIKWDKFSRESNKPTFDTIRHVFGKLNLSPMVMVRDGCLSFVPLTHVESTPNEKRDRWQSEMEVCPFVIEIDRDGFTIKAYADLENAGLVTVSVELPYYENCQHFGHIHTTRKRVRGNSASGDVINCNFAPSSKLHVIYDGERPIAQLESPIKWASGGANYENRFTAYFIHMADNIASPINLIDTLSK